MFNPTHQTKIKKWTDTLLQYPPQGQNTVNRSLLISVTHFHIMRLSNIQNNISSSFYLFLLDIDAFHLKSGWEYDIFFHSCENPLFEMRLGLPHSDVSCFSLSSLSLFLVCLNMTHFVRFQSGEISQKSSYHQQMRNALPMCVEHFVKWMQMYCLVFLFPLREDLRERIQVP